MQNTQKLKEADLHDVYYHVRFRDGSGYTVCLVLDKEEALIARGVAICSKQDQFNRRTGRVLALARAMQAITHKDCLHRIKGNPYDTFMTQLSKTSAMSFVWKAAYKPNPTEYERENILKEKEEVGV